MVASYGERRKAIEGRSLPCALLDLDLLERNAFDTLRRANGLPVRIGTKSIRCAGALRFLFSLSPNFRGLLAYDANEAAWLASLGFDDIVVAYPTLEPKALEAVADSLAGGHRITLMVDDVAQLEALSGAAASRGIVMPVCIDLDMSSSFPGLYFGVQRSPVRTPQEALALARAIAANPSLHLEGLMGYEAQISGLQDDLDGKRVKNTVIRALKARSMREIALRRSETLMALENAGFTLHFVNGGGTGSLECTAADPSVTEVTAGSAFFGPVLFDGFSAFRTLPALTFALPVVRRPDSRTFTCSGGGYIASGPAGRDRWPTPYLPRGGRLLHSEGAGEVQTPVTFANGTSLDLGDPIFFRHAKAGELCERFERILCMKGGAVVDEFTTYRGDARCFF